MGRYEYPVTRHCTDRRPDPPWSGEKGGLIRPELGGPVEETQTEAKADDRKRLDDWFDYKFLTIYQNTTNVERGRKVLHRYQPTDEILETIYEWVLADNRARYRAKQKGDFYPNPPNCYSFFHESRWMDKLSQVQEHRKIEHRCICGIETKNLYPVNGQLCCIKCYDDRRHPEFKRQVYNNLCQHGLGKLKTETREQWLQRMKQMGRYGFSSAARK